MRMPEAGPFGETFLEAKVLAMVEALFVNNPEGGWVESVFTLATHLFFGLRADDFLLAIFFRSTPPAKQSCREIVRSRSAPGLVSPPRAAIPGQPGVSGFPGRPVGRFAQALRH